MSERHPKPEVRCTVTEEEEGRRRREELPTLKRSYAGHDEVRDGYTLKFLDTEETLASLLTFVSRERSCCSFARYSISSSPPYDEVRLWIEGPEGTKEHFQELIEELETDDGPEAVSNERLGAAGSDDDGVSSIERRRAVREQYADVAESSASEDSDGNGGCCTDGVSSEQVEELSRMMGYSEGDLEAVEADANLGLGCGNPTALADLEEGEVVLDLGSGGGFDCFLAAEEVGPDGQVIGVDMTPEMVERARENRRENGFSNVEFRLGEIENLPVADESVDTAISNCVVNLSDDKSRVYEEVYRVLSPGGRLAISDVVVTTELPDELKDGGSSVASCIAGGFSIDEVRSTLEETGFEDVEVEPKEDSDELIREWDGERDLSDYLVSAYIRGRKPES